MGERSPREARVTLLTGAGLSVAFDDVHLGRVEEILPSLLLEASA